jgi:hypothetical protein
MRVASGDPILAIAVPNDAYLLLTAAIDVVAGITGPITPPVNTPRTSVRSRWTPAPLIDLELS